MRYVSTRGQAPGLDFAGVTLAGLAGDGGLYLPERWPAMTADARGSLAGLGYAETAAAVMAPFVGDALTRDELAAMCAAAYATFDHAAVVPLRQLDERHWLLELFHGPTLAFKDVALQLLGRLFERLLGAGERLTVIGATSGDTGSAAIAALAGLANVEVFMLHPAGRISEVQRRQMTTVLADNVHNIAVEGSFDDAQRIVKALLGRADVRARFALSAVNSINWARLMAQAPYYAWATARLGPAAFSVPTGNFGDIFAGHVAARMGFPVARLIAATNANDIVARALADGDYSAGQVVATDAPSMDIQVSSNFERLLFDLGGHDEAATAAQMATFDESGAIRLSEVQRAGIAAMFTGARVDADEMAATMRWAHERCGTLIDPHTAIGLAAARRAGVPGNVPMVTLATAHPAKFPDAVKRATGVRPELPGRLADLLAREERYATLPAGVDAVAEYVMERGR